MVTAHDLRPPDGFTFEEDGHIYRQGGVRLPSATQIRDFFGLGDDYSGVNPYAVRVAGVRGTAIHRALAYYAEDDLDLDSLSGLGYEADVLAAIDCLATARAEPIAAEVRLTSMIWNVAGTVDLVCRLYEQGRLAIIDYKTGGDKGADVQLTLYRIMMVSTLAMRGIKLGEPIDLYVMNIKDGAAKLRPITPVEEIDATALVRTWHYLNERRQR